MKLGLFFAVSSSIKQVQSQAGTDYQTDFDDFGNYGDEELGSGFLQDSMINKRLAPGSNVNPFFNLIQESDKDTGNIMERASFRELLEQNKNLFASSQNRLQNRPKKNRREKKDKRKRKEKVMEPIIVNEYGIATNYVESPSEKMSDFQGRLEGFNINKYSDSPIVQKIRQATIAKEVTISDRNREPGAGLSSINSGKTGEIGSEEQANAKKLEVIMKMTMFLQADPNFEKVYKYGCWCFRNGEKSVLGGSGNTIDGADRACKAYQQCHKCMDNDYNDCPAWVPYRFEGKINDDGRKTITCLNQEGSCRRNHCECDKKLAEDLALHEMTLNPLNRRDFGFEPEQACKKADSRSISTSHATETSCCGVYPNRFPFVSNRNQGESLRKCCLNKTYDPRKLACCPGHEVKNHGTCGV
ncbi:Oidioi.mRNA.OKI2018_I69.chr2.g4303.t1.cds [Oikopleura dioica]|uniref:Oidioi.mRNA.OKI2018_I69.chr2.g4303.t1.cds n=1 Tax=Oikopleura dioica TaxID=34765 RepID=A0ABN7T2D0_OIKDI|nr:Oidioi.mRNA.OKI2018_I69.chr2.g4303.t1.cds [Oikopleura dioica]